LKKKINEIVESRQSNKAPPSIASNPQELAKNSAEVEFFILIRKELKKASDFFNKCQEEHMIRWERIWESYLMLQEKTVTHDKNTWTRLLMACVRFYKDVLLLENFAIMNYCGFSKILKKHDKLTG
jgi:SPX domain protein involved in polyphosphate accumulation